MATTLGTRLAACLQEAGMACPDCNGYGTYVSPEAALDMRVEPCPTCKGDGIAPEYRQEPNDEWGEGVDAVERTVESASNRKERRPSSAEGAAISSVPKATLASPPNECWPTEEEERAYDVWKAVTTLRELAPELLSEKAAMV